MLMLMLICSLHYIYITRGLPVLHCLIGDAADAYWFLVCNTVQPLLDSLQSVLTLGYLDDVSLGGCQKSVAADVSRIIESGQRLGLHLNAS